MRFNDGGKTGVAPPLLSDVLIVWPWGEGRGSLKCARCPSAAVVCCGLCLNFFFIVLPPHLTYAASLHTRCATVGRGSSWYHRRSLWFTGGRDCHITVRLSLSPRSLPASAVGLTSFACTPPPPPPFFFTVQQPT